MAAVLDACQVRSAVVGGLSLGGYLSLAFNVEHPDRVAGLILCDTGPGYRKDEPRAKWNAMAARFADAFDRDGLDARTGSPEVQAAHHQQCGRTRSGRERHPHSARLSGDRLTGDDLGTHARDRRGR